MTFTEYRISDIRACEGTDEAKVKARAWLEKTTLLLGKYRPFHDPETVERMEELRKDVYEAACLMGLSDKDFVDLKSKCPLCISSVH